MPSKHQLARYPEHVQAIGMIALEIVDLELQLALLFSRMLFISPTVGEAIYMTPRGDQARLDILRNATKAGLGRSLSAKKTKALKKVLTLVSRAQTAISYRHRAMHDDWSVSRSTHEINRIRVDGDMGRQPELVPIVSLNQEIKTIRQLIDDVTKLADEFRASPPTLVSMRQ